LDRKEVEDTRYFSGSFISIPFFCTRLIHVTTFFYFNPFTMQISNTTPTLTNCIWSVSEISPLQQWGRPRSFSISEPAIRMDGFTAGITRIFYTPTTSARTARCTPPRALRADRVRVLGHWSFLFLSHFFCSIFLFLFLFFIFFLIGLKMLKLKQMIFYFETINFF
jgi:hypothetical protein